MKKMTLVLLAATSAFSVMADEGSLLSEGREVAQKMPPKLLEVLNGEIQRVGHAGALSVCREKAPQLAKALSEKSGWSIRRVSLKNRNPKAAPDAWEQAVLEEFDRRAQTESSATLEKGELVVADGKKTYRYMKALPTQELCLSCHGAEDQIPAEVRSKLKEVYPEDKATGYRLGQIRGAITLKKDL